MGNIKNLKMKSFTTQTILATLAYSVLTVNGLNVQRGIMSAIQQDVAKLGETCERINWKTIPILCLWPRLRRLRQNDHYRCSQALHHEQTIGRLCRWPRLQVYFWRWNPRYP